MWPGCVYIQLLAPYESTLRLIEAQNTGKLLNDLENSLKPFGISLEFISTKKVELIQLTREDYDSLRSHAEEKLQEIFETTESSPTNSPRSSPEVRLMPLNFDLVKPAIKLNCIIYDHDRIYTFLAV